MGVIRNTRPNFIIPLEIYDDYKGFRCVYNITGYSTLFKNIQAMNIEDMGSYLSCQKMI